MQNLILDLKPSKILFTILLILHSGAIMCLSYAALPDYLKIVLVIICTFSLATLILDSQKARKISWDCYKGWCVHKLGGELMQVQLHHSSLRTRWLVILNFKTERVTEFLSFLIFPDTISPEIFRQLRVNLLRNQGERG